MVHVKNLKKANTYFSSFVTHILGINVSLTVLQYILSNCLSFIICVYMYFKITQYFQTRATLPITNICMGKNQVKLKKL